MAARHRVGTTRPCSMRRRRSWRPNGSACSRTKRLLWERELADLLAEMPAPRPAPPRVGVTTTGRRRSGQPMPEHGRRGGRRGDGSPCPGMGYPAVPSGHTPGVLLKGPVGQGR